MPQNFDKLLRESPVTNHKSIAEIVESLDRSAPCEAELVRRREAFDRLAELRARPPLTSGPFPSAEEMIREDRER